MSEEITEIEQLDEQEREELDQKEQPEGEGEQEQPPTDDAAKLKKALSRERAAKKKLQTDLAELRKAQKSGDMGEADSLKETVEQLRQEVTTTKAEAALLRAGYSGDKPEQMIKLLDLDDLAVSLEELKEEFPEKFGKKGTPRSDYKPGGPAGTSKTPTKDPTTKHSEELLGRHRGG